VNDYSLVVPTSAHIILIYISPYLASTCFGWSPFSGSLQPILIFTCCNFSHNLYIHIHSIVLLWVLSCLLHDDGGQPKHVAAVGIICARDCNNQQTFLCDQNPVYFLWRTKEMFIYYINELNAAIFRLKATHVDSWTHNHVNLFPVCVKWYAVFVG